MEVPAMPRPHPRNGPVSVRAQLVSAVLFPVCLGALVAPALLKAAPQAADTVPASFLADPLLYFFDARSAEALRYGEAALRDPATPENARKNVLLTLGTIHLAQGEEAKAKESFRRIFAADPTAEIDEPCRLPEPVRRLFYRLRYEACSAKLDALVASGKLGMNIR